MIKNFPVFHGNRMFITVFTRGIFQFTLGVGWDWVHLLFLPLFGLLYQPRMIGNDDCRAIGGIRIGKGNRSTRRKPVPVPLCAPQIPYDLICARTQAAAVGITRCLLHVLCPRSWVSFRNMLTDCLTDKHMKILANSVVWGLFNAVMGIRAAMDVKIPPSHIIMSRFKHAEGWFVPLLISHTKTISLLKF
jgi:hypothetical protein